MPYFGRRSTARLNTCSPNLQRLWREVIKHRDCTILEGHRGKRAQDAAYAAGNSKRQWPDGRHNTWPSKASDVGPWPFPAWNDAEEFRRFAHFVLGVAAVLGIPIRWGGDWDGDWDLSDQTFNDLVHFEEIES